MDRLPDTIAIYNATLDPSYGIKKRFAILSCSYQASQSEESSTPPTYCLSSLGVTATGQARGLSYDVRKVGELGAMPVHPCKVYAAFKSLGSLYYSYSNEELYYTDIKRWIPVVIFSIDLPFASHPFAATNDTDYFATRRAYFFREIQKKLAQYRYPLVRAEPEEDPSPLEPPAPPPLRQVPAFVADALLQSTIQQKKECSFTMSPFETLASVAVTPCYHLFDKASLIDWMGQKRECPLCKGPLTKETLYSLDLRK